jgi:2-polyprenyl-3-methyl-5-hydroxy-6-metoxy-1,4-benzoquinol methylase
VTPTRRVEGPTADVAPADWDHHWDAYGEAAEGNPANVYRHRLILGLLGPLRRGETLLDIGSGQGEFAIAFKRLHPETDVWGVEFSALGVQRSQKSAATQGVDAKFVRRDLLAPVQLEEGQPAATYAVCSEVLEHVEDPTTLMRNAVSLLAPGAKLVVTVPGGPRSAFDRHIGHWRHFDAITLRQVLTDAGLHVDRIQRAGFPGFNLYKLAVIARGKGLIRELDSRQPGARPSRSEVMATTLFQGLFRLNRDDSPLGWQLAAVAHTPDGGI